MPKYIKIKNATGKGEMVLKSGLILKVEDREEGGASVLYGQSIREWNNLKTASTAAEVLEAMEGKQTVRGTLRIQGNSATVWHHADLSTPLGECIHPDAFKETSTPVVEPLRPTRCVTYSTYSDGKRYELSLGPDGATAGCRDLEQEVNAKPPVSTPKRFVVRRGSNDWRVYNTKPLEGDDGCDGIFITRERAEEYAASRERETAQHGTGYGGSESVLDAENSCFCTNFAGQNSKCPQHGIGTAWRDLHGE